jgi:hypothetical protein
MPSTHACSADVESVGDEVGVDAIGVGVAVGVAVCVAVGVAVAVPGAGSLTVVGVVSRSATPRRGPHVVVAITSAITSAVAIADLP